LVRGHLPGDSSGEPRAGESTLLRQSRACYAFSGSERHGPGRASVEPTLRARARGRTRLSRDGRRCARLLRPRTAMCCLGPPSLLQRWLRSNGGDCQLPLEPRRARNNALHTGVFPGMRVSGVMLIGRLQVSNPREGVEFTRSSGTSGSHSRKKLVAPRPNLPSSTRRDGAKRRGDRLGRFCATPISRGLAASTLQ